jgi:uncharacterized protein (DUF302 family)
MGCLTCQKSERRSASDDLEWRNASSRNLILNESPLIKLFLLVRLFLMKEDEGVQFDTIAREWRCKWSSDNDKKSLQEVQKVLDEVLEEIKKVDGVKGVQ